MRLLILILFFTIPTTAQTVRARLRCTEPETASPCLNKDGSVRRHTVEEWKAIEEARPKKLNAAEQKASVEGVEKIADIGQPIAGLIAVVAFIVALFLLWSAKRQIKKLEE